MQQCWSRALLLLVSCSELLIQLSNQGSISIRSETIQSVTYRWYLDGDLLDKEQNAQLILAESSLDVGSHRITVVVQTGLADMQYASAETRITIGL